MTSIEHDDRDPVEMALDALQPAITKAERRIFLAILDRITAANIDEIVAANYEQPIDPKEPTCPAAFLTH